jgi:hypothetical protein
MVPMPTLPLAAMTHTSQTNTGATTRAQSSTADSVAPVLEFYPPPLPPHKIYAWSRALLVKVDRGPSRQVLPCPPWV